MFDAVVIGGGPAGSATAVRLARIGMRVRLYEKARFPRPKLCGGFLSPECLADLEALGVLDELRAAGAFPVRRILLSSPRGAVAEAPLPSAGLSVSRQTLDMILLNRARAEGVDVKEGIDGFAQRHESPWTIVASGRNGNAEKPIYFGLQAYFEAVDGVTDQVELDLIPGGYVGLVKQGKNLVNLCALTTRQDFQKTGAAIETLLPSWVRQNPVLQKHLSRARQVSDWKAVGPVQMGVRQLTASGRLFVGDAACVVDPFVGEGISMGLQGAQLIQKAFLDTRQRAEVAYEQAWRARFSAARRLDGWLRWWLRFPLVQNIFVSGLKKYPAVLTWLTENTRPQQNSTFPAALGREN